MSSTHTPGPWLAVIESPRYSHGMHYISVESSDLFLAKTCGRSLEEAQANARLIAVAPDLLAALKHLIQRMDDNPEVRAACLDSMPQAVEYARSAISKAEGAK